MKAPGLCLGIDLGGTKIEAQVLDPTGSVVFRRRVASPSHAYEAILDALAGLVAAADAACGRLPAVGICTPGALSTVTGLLKNANTVCLNGTDLRHDLVCRVGRPVFIENDANCFALSEATNGAAADARCAFGVILGTGAGGGIVVDGRLLSGANHIAGEWGHNHQAPPADETPGQRACYCGRLDCVETYVSGPGLSRTYQECGGAAHSAERIATLMGAGDALALRAFERYVQHLASALAAVVNILDPDVIVLGGGLSKVGRLYPMLAAALPPYVFSDVVRTVIVPPRFGDASGVRGAAWLAGAGAASSPVGQAGATS